MRRPPLVGGGQGRSPSEVRSSATAIGWLALIGLILALVLASIG